MKAGSTGPGGELAGRRVAVLGVGNELNADDGVGVRVVRELGRMLPARSDVLLIEAGGAPENFTGAIRRFQPDTVIIADAAAMGDKVGAIRWIDWRASDGFSGSTHTLPPSVLARFLMETVGCDVVLLGIQPASVEFDQPMSAAVEAAAREAARQLSARIGLKRDPAPFSEPTEPV
ncbi:MAG: hydrogenase maturation peptidase HycI [Vicinamibacterales bacterium]